MAPTLTTITKKLKDAFTHPIYACVFLSVLRVSSTYIGWLNQGKYLENATQSRKKRMRKQEWELGSKGEFTHSV